eukprot:3867631-Pleurochrysis_carterae.AAC.1
MPNGKLDDAGSALERSMARVSHVGGSFQHSCAENEDALFCAHPVSQVQESVRAEVWQEVLASARAEAQAQVARHIEQWKSDAAWVGPTASRKQTAEAGTNTDVVARRSVQTSTDVTSASTADSATSTSPWLRRGSITGPDSADQLEGSAGQRSHRFPLNTSPP